MPVHKRGSTWHVRLQIEGRRLSCSAGEGASKADAIALEAKLRADHRAGKLGRAPARSLSEAIARWLDGDAAHLKSRANLLGKAALLLPYCRGRNLNEVAEVAAACKADWTRDGLKPATINRRLAILRRVANLAYTEWGWLDEPLAQRIKLLSGERARHVYLTSEQAAALHRACEHPRVADAILVALMTGLRQSEILKLTEANRHDGILLLDAETKSGRPRAVPDVPVQLPLGITYATLRTYYERARQKAGLPNVRFHDLRHTTASWLIANGADMVQVRDLLGHANLAVTSRYAHLQPGAIHNAADRLRAVPFLCHSGAKTGQNVAQTDAPANPVKSRKTARKQ